MERNQQQGERTHNRVEIARLLQRMEATCPEWQKAARKRHIAIVMEPTSAARRRAMRRTARQEERAGRLVREF